MSSLLLDRSVWDLTVDARRNIALSDDPYATAQDIACAQRLFLAECWYARERGIPYFQRVLGRAPPLALVKALLVKAALTVPTVATAQVFIATIRDRALRGQTQATMKTGRPVPIVSTAYPPPGVLMDEWGNPVTDRKGHPFYVGALAVQPAGAGPGPNGQYTDELDNPLTEELGNPLVRPV